MVMTEENLEDTVKEENEEMSIWEKRMSAVLLVLGGLTSAGISHLTVGFETLAGLIPVIPVTLVIVLLFKYKFDSFSNRTIPFVLIITFFLWFITGTFILQLL